MISQLCRISAALSAAIVAGQGQRNQALRRIFRRTQLDRGSAICGVPDYLELVPLAVGDLDGVMVAGAA